MEPATKRVKAPTVDLTLSDSDSDDDIVITGVRTVKDSPKPGLMPQKAAPSASRLTSLYSTPQSPRTLNGTGPSLAHSAPTNSGNSSAMAASTSLSTPDKTPLVNRTGTSTQTQPLTTTTAAEPTYIRRTDKGLNVFKPAAPLRPDQVKAALNELSQFPEHVADHAKRILGITPAVELQARASTPTPAPAPVATQASASSPATQVKPKPEDGQPQFYGRQNAQTPKLKTEQPKTEGVRVHHTGAVESHGHFYKTVADLTQRENELKQRLEKYRRGLMILEAKRKNRPQKQIELKQKRDQLLRLGTAQDNPQIVKLNQEMQKLSDESRTALNKEKVWKESVERAVKKLNMFTTREKPKLLPVLKEREAQLAEQRRQEIQRKQQEALRREQERIKRQEELRQRALQQNLRGNVRDNWGNMANVVNNAVDAGRQLFGNMGAGAGAGMAAVQAEYTRYLAQLQRRQEERDRLLMNPMALNAYNTNQEDLAHLLESVKKQEEQEIDGESNTPDELLVNLLKHQRMGLKWLEDTEEDKKKRGGILGDAMGLGKTVQMIALMMSRRAEKVDEEEAEEYGKTNLVVAPVSLINQWQSEIETKIKEATGVSILMYHSMGGRKVKWDEMKKYDVVMTSYGTLSSELNKHMKDLFPGTKVELKEPPNLREINQKKNPDSYQSPFYSAESKFYRIILDECQQIKNKLTRASISVSVLESYHRWCLSGTPMQNNVDELYPLLRFLRIRPYNDQKRFKEDISLKLDIKNRKYDEWDREDAIKKLRLLLRSVMLRREKDSKIDGKPILDLPEKKVIVTNTLLSTNKNEESFYNSIEESTKLQVKKILGRPTAKGDYSYIFVLLLRLRQACLHSELVRIGDRKKGVIYDDDGNVISTANVESMCKNAKKFRPEVVRRINESLNTDAAPAEGEIENKFTCPICLDPTPEDQVVLFFPCGHNICKECSNQYFEEFQTGGDEHVRVADCTTCRMAVKENELVDLEVFDKHVNKGQSLDMLKIVYDQKKQTAREAVEELENLKLENLEYSPKIAATIKLLQDIWKKAPEDKVIIFSHFTSFFFILRKFLKREDIESLSYLGSMGPDERNEVVKDFYRDPKQKLLLISLKAGNSGLTLTCANHVIIMDPFWNPYVEYQAQDRAHRIGQQKPVTVYRMLIEGTVEDRILELQERKKQLIESAMDPTGMKEVSRLSREDIARLFNITNL